MQAKGLTASQLGTLQRLHPTEERGSAERNLVRAHSSETVASMLSTGSGKADDGKPADTWEESATHEGCMLFGYVDVSRAPGTLHFAPVSPRHSFDFSHVNTSHHIDHLSFGLELASSKRAALPRPASAHAP